MKWSSHQKFIYFCLACHLLHAEHFLIKTSPSTCRVVQCVFFVPCVHFVAQLIKTFLLPVLIKFTCFFLYRTAIPIHFCCFIFLIIFCQFEPSTSKTHRHTPVRSRQTVFKRVSSNGRKKLHPLREKLDAVANCCTGMKFNIQKKESHSIDGNRLFRNCETANDYSNCQRFLLSVNCFEFMKLISINFPLSCFIRKLWPNIFSSFIQNHVINCTHPANIEGKLTFQMGFFLSHPSILLSLGMIVFVQLNSITLAIDYAE